MSHATHAGRARLLLFFALLVISLVLAVAPRAALGATVTVRSCGDAIPSPGAKDQQWTASNGVNMDAVVSCPGGITFSQPGPTPGWTAGELSWSPERAWNIEAVSFDVSGGDTSGGLRYLYEECVHCGDLRPFDRNPDSPDERVTLPLNGPGFAMYAYCAIDECEPTRPLTLRNFEFVATDDAAPDLGGWLNGDSVGSPAFGLVWTNDRALTSYLYTADGGAGLSEAGASLSRTRFDIWSPTISCDSIDDLFWTYLEPCPGEAMNNSLIDISGVGEGVYDAEMHAKDFFGLTSQASGLKLGIDRTLPEPPTHLRWETPASSPHGWTSDPEVRLAWDVPLPEGDEASPLTFTRYDVREVDGPVVFSNESWEVSTGAGPYSLPYEGLWRVSGRFIDGAGNVGEPASKEIGYDHDAPPAPALDPHSWVSAPALLNGYGQHWTQPDTPEEVESGVCGFAVVVDQSDTTVPPASETVGAEAREFQLRANLSEGTHFVHVRAVSCAGVGSDTRTERVDVDRTAPRLGLSGASGQQWMPGPATVSAMAEDDLSGVAEVTLHEGEPEAAAEVLDDHTLQLGDGVHTLEFSATDVAGNQTELQTRVLNIDGTAPAILIQPQDPERPSALGARVSDAMSGIASAEFQYRPSSSSAWVAIPSSGGDVPPGSKSVQLSASVPDEALPAGQYTIRALAKDVAGNVRIAGQRTVDLPLRKATEISAAVADVRSRCVTAAGKRCVSVAKCARRSRCHRVTYVDRDTAAKSVTRPFDAAVAVVGDIFDADGNPRAGLHLVVMTDVPEFGVETRSEVTVGEDGHFEARLPHGPSRSVRVSFAGDAASLPAAADAELGVRASATMHASSVRVRGGSRVRFRGRVVGASDFAARGGKIVVPQFAAPSGWLPALGSPVTDTHGRYSVDYKTPKVTKRTRVSFRLQVPSQYGWPYESGVSPTVKLTILP